MPAEFADPAAEDVSATVPVGIVHPETVGWTFVEHVDGGMRVPLEATAAASGPADVYLQGSPALGSTPCATDSCILPASTATHIPSYQGTKSVVDWLPSLPPEVPGPTADAWIAETPDFTFTAGVSSPAEASEKGQGLRRIHSSIALPADITSAAVPTAPCSAHNGGVEGSWHTPVADLLQKDTPAGCEQHSSDVADSANSQMDGVQDGLKGCEYGTQSASTGVWMRVASADSVAWTKSEEDASCEGLSQ